ncbi:hypothetical protein L917_19376, partial [Phytophthora nicotianae]
MNMELKALELGSLQVGSSLSMCHVGSVVPGREAGELLRIRDAKVFVSSAGERKDEAQCPPTSWQDVASLRCFRER